MDTEKLAAVKLYMRKDGDDEDGLIEALYAAAQLYLRNGGVPEPEDEAPLYNLAVWSLTLYYYDHRDDIGSDDAFPPGLRPIINQLKLSNAEGAL